MLISQNGKRNIKCRKEIYSVQKKSGKAVFLLEDEFKLTAF